MNLVLISSEEADRRSLMHYRTKGSKNGQRRYQNEDGSLTPLGYIHYGIDPGNGSANSQQMPRPMLRRNAALGSSNAGGSANKNANAKQVNKSGGNQVTSSRIPAPSSRPINGSQANARSSNQANSSRLPVPNSRQTSGSRNVPVATGAPVNMSRIPAPSSRPTNGSGKPTQGGNQINSTQNSNPVNASRIPAPSSRPVNGSKIPAPQKNTSANNQAEKQKAQYGKAGFKAMGGVNKNGQITDASGKPIINKKDGNGKYFGKGNIDLNSRKVVKNEDGSISTERSFSVNIDGKETLLPTVIDGKVVDEDTAIDHYYETGEHLGQFDTVDEAESYAQQLHNRQDWYYNRKDVKHADTDENDEDYLMHYRTKGSKNGVRLYQNKDGSLTALGRIHYGIGIGRKTRAVNAAIREQKQIDAIDNKIEKTKTSKIVIGDRDKRIQRLEEAKQKIENKDTNRRAKEEDKLLKKAEKYDKKMAKIGLTTHLADLRRKNNERAEAAIAEEKQRLNGPKDNNPASTDSKKLDPLTAAAALSGKDGQIDDHKASIKEVRGWSDDELQRAITRLQKEKQYSELVNERENREKGPIKAMASKLLQDAAQDLAKKSLGVAVDNLVAKLKQPASFTLDEFKNVDPYKLDSNKLQAVSLAFNQAAQLMRNRNVVNNGGIDPSQGDGNKNNGNNNGNNNNNQNSQSNQNTNSGTERPNGPNGELSKKQKSRIRAAASSGQSAAELAKQFGVSESTIYEVAGGSFKQDKLSGEQARKRS